MTEEKTKKKNLTDQTRPTACSGICAFFTPLDQNLFLENNK